jgi:hypothetical protein
MDLLTVLEGEIGHLLGQEQEANRLMAKEVAAGTRQVPGSDAYAADLTAAHFRLDVPSAAVPWIHPINPWSRRTK